MATPKKPAAKTRRARTKVGVEFDYAEASFLVVATNVLFGAMPDDEAQRSLKGPLDKLYKAEPRLKEDARRVESEMRGLLAPGGVDVDDDDDDDDIQPLAGAQYLEHIAIAMDERRPLSLVRKDAVVTLTPTGMGQIGAVAIAVGWSATHEDHVLVRLDEILGVSPETRSDQSPAGDLIKASLDRLCQQPQPQGSQI